MVEPSDEQRASGDFDLAFTCVFCGLSVNEDAPDFCTVDVGAPGGFLQVWCHAGCIRAAAADPESFPDLVGEPEERREPDPDLDAAEEALDGVLDEIQVAEIDDPAAMWALAQALAAAARRHDVEIDAAGEALEGVIASLEFAEPRDAAATWALANALLETAQRHGIDIEVDDLDAE